jgi:hypothetical protein
VIVDPPPGSGTLRDFCGVELRVLPDFLLDHSLLSDRPEQRLPELCTRWIQFVQRLSAWQDGTVFCLRFDGDPAHSAVRIHLLARPGTPERRDALQRDLEYALRIYGVIGNRADYGQYLPLLTPAEIGALPLGAARRDLLRGEIRDSFAAALRAPPAAAGFVGLVQEVSGRIWHNQSELKTILDDPRLRRLARRDDGPPQAWLPLNWEGPSGPFTLPFRALLAAPCPVRVSVYLKPSAVHNEERLWLEKLAQASRRSSEALDPIVELASARAASAARRLLANTFLTAVECVAADATAAERMAEVLRSLCLEMPPQVELADGPLPGAVLVAADPADCATARAEHAGLRFPSWIDAGPLPAYAVRLPYLADARAAATLFRLPVSVRSGVPGVAVAQAVPDFNPGPVGNGDGSADDPVYRPVRPQQQVQIGRFETSGEASVPLDDLTKHALIVGFTGTGKTKTVLHLLHQLWADHRVPFLVIESAKSEYRGLLGMPEFNLADGSSGLMVYTAGNDGVSPYRLNPFELLPGVRVEAHVNRLQTCFEAALPPFGPLASILEQSLIEIYRDAGWMMTETATAADPPIFPTMVDFARKLQRIGLSRGYEGEFKATLQAAITGRIMPLTRAMHGSKGNMLDVARNRPSAQELFARPTVLELKDLNQQDKALISMFLLTLLREYRELRAAEEGEHGHLRHVTVIEEAHNVLQDVASTGGQEGGRADVQYRAVQAFCAMLTEIRAYGEGIVIADQSPVKLAPDAIRNTNLQIAHQLRDTRDRLAIANAMIMTDEQRDYLGRLRAGHAGVFYTGLQKASFVTVPQFDDPANGGRGVGYRAVVTDAEVIAHMEPISGDLRKPDRPFDGCRHCGSYLTCDYRWRARALLTSDSRRKAFLAAATGQPTPEAAFVALTPIVAATGAGDTAAERADAAWCALLHMRHAWAAKSAGSSRFDAGMRDWFTKFTVPRLDRTENPTDGWR